MGFFWIYYLVDNIEDTSPFGGPEDYSLTFTTECVSDPTTGTCDPSPGQELPFDSFAAWAARSEADATLPPVYHQFYSVNTFSNPTPDSLRQHFFRSVVTTQNAGFEWLPFPDRKPTTPTPVRCDGANEYPGYTDGCIFNNVIPFLTYSTAPDSKVRAVAEHIRDAFTNPSITDPPLAGKAIPGEFSSSTYVRRTRNGMLQDHNRDAAVAVCLQLDPAYASKDQDCDEFPFASTREGASTSQTSQLAS